MYICQVGLPSKSGVSGCVLLVIPNTMGICLWSPPLDSNGNSCRAVQFCMVSLQASVEKIHDAFILHSQTIFTLFTFLCSSYPYRICWRLDQCDMHYKFHLQYKIVNPLTLDVDSTYFSVYIIIIHD